MSYRTIVIESPARISLQHNQLVVITDCSHTIAVEDITALLIESNASTITTAALSFLGRSGCAVFFCDEKHMPCSITTPYAQHCRNAAILQQQLAVSQPLKKRLWQEMIVAKIQNQAKCLSYMSFSAAADELTALSLRVRSGDPDNLEALAASKYFLALFGKGFTRSGQNGINSALNYGYALLRGYIARTIALYGLLPSFGLHHHSELNAFNLADDLIEPFRPLIDLLVKTYFDEETVLSSDSKHLLFNCFQLDIRSSGQRHSTAYAVERLVQSLVRSFENKKPLLCLPSLLELHQHRYE